MNASFINLLSISDRDLQLSMLVLRGKYIVNIKYIQYGCLGNVEFGIVAMVPKTGLLWLSYHFVKSVYKSRSTGI